MSFEDFFKDGSLHPEILMVSSVAVHTWNVAGKRPPQDLDLEEWIGDSQPADIYVFGYVYRDQFTTESYIQTEISRGMPKPAAVSKKKL